MNQNARHELMEWHLLNWTAEDWPDSTVTDMLRWLDGDIKSAEEVVSQLQKLSQDDPDLIMWTNELNRLNDLKARYRAHFQL